MHIKYLSIQSIFFAQALEINSIYKQRKEKKMDKEKVIIEKLDDIKESIDLLLKLVGTIHESQMFSLLSPLERSLQSEEFQNLLSECEQTLSDS